MSSIVQSSFPGQQQLDDILLERKQWLEVQNKNLDKFLKKSNYYGITTVKNATKSNAVQAFLNCGELLYNLKITSTSAQGCPYLVTEAAQFVDFAKRLLFIFNNLPNLTTPELRLAKAEALLRGNETVNWVDCSDEFVGQRVYDYWGRSRNQGVSFNHPFPNKVDELWKKEVAKRGLTCADDEFTVERKRAIFDEALKCIIKKLKKKIAALAEADI